MQTKTDKSFGVITVYRSDAGFEFLLVHQISYRKDTFWIFPKGHGEAGESDTDAALRELEEETGLQAVKLDTGSTFAMRYEFIDNGVKISKTVTYYIGYVSAKMSKISQPHEIKELRWCSGSEANKLLTHQKSKNILAEVEDYLSK